MSKTIAFGLIIFFLLVIVAGLVWLLFFSGSEGIQGAIGKFFPVAGERDRPVPTVPGPADGAGASGPNDETARRLIQISEGRVSGFKPIAGGVRYIERATGHVFESNPDGRNQVRVSNTTIPGIFDSVWSYNADGAVIRYRENEKARMASVRFVGTTTAGVLLPASILSVAYAPNRARLVYVAEVNGTLAVIAADPDNSKQSEMLRLPPADFEISWPVSNTLYFVTRPSGEADGYLYKYNIDKKNFSKFYGPEHGLEVNFDSLGKKVLLSVFDPSGNRPELVVLDSASGERTNLESATLARKCAWSAANTIICAIPADIPSGIYPDAWYKGQVGFNDSLWQINIDTLTKENLANLPDIDVEAMAIAPDGSHVYFQDKKEGALWGYKLTP